MGLTIKEVRNPVPRVRAERVRAALEAGGNLNEYIVAGAIDPNDGVSILRSKVVGQAMTLADAAIAGETIMLECVQLSAGATIIVTPANLTGGTTITFSAVGQRIVLIWDIVPATDAWAPRGGATAVVA